MRRQLQRTTAGVAAGALLLVAVIGWQLSRNARYSRQQGMAASSSASPLPIGTLATLATPAAPGALRPVYGHALVRGGVHSIAELAALLRADSQLADHYKSFDLPKAYIITLDHNAMAYVSYRIEKSIYWTTHPILIQKGEDLITDGTIFIRAACANQIAYAPGIPTSPAEPQDVGIIVALIAPPPAVLSFESRGSPTDYDLPPIGELPIEGALQATQNAHLDGGPLPPPILTLSGRGPAVRQFSADQFTTISTTVFQHPVKLPMTLITLFAGILLLLALHFLLRRLG